VLSFVEAAVLRAPPHRVRGFARLTSSSPPFCVVGFIESGVLRVARPMANALIS
jgi:hypothetical protein